MEDRRFTEVDLREMLQKATGLRKHVVPGRWVAVSRHRRKNWRIIVEPDPETKLLVIVTAYPE
jgi:hypothetical protein